MLKIKELANLYGISTQTVRYYEKEGLLSPSMRDETSGYRYYSEDEVNKLAQIMQLREVGFHIGQIKNFFNNEFNKEEKIQELNRIIGACYYQIMVLESDNNDFSVIHTKLTGAMNVIKRTTDVGEPIAILNLYGEMVEYVEKNHLHLTLPRGVYITFTNEEESHKEIAEIMLCVDKTVEGITIPVKEQKIAFACFSGSLYEIYETIEKFKQAVIKAGYVLDGDVIQRYLSPCNPVSYHAVIEFEVPIK